MHNAPNTTFAVLGKDLPDLLSVCQITHMDIDLGALNVLLGCVVG